MTNVATKSLQVANASTGKRVSSTGKPETQTDTEACGDGLADHKQRESESTLPPIREVASVSARGVIRAKRAGRAIDYREIRQERLTGSEVTVK